MTCRTPVIVTPVGAAPELISSGSGLLVPHDDSQATANAILQMINLRCDHWKLISAAVFRTATSYIRDDAPELFEQALRQAMERAIGGVMAEPVQVESVKS